MTAAWPRVPAAAEVCTIVLGFALASTMPVLAADAETPSADSGYVDRLIDRIRPINCMPTNCATKRQYHRAGAFPVSNTSPSTVVDR
jgi:hypothetical protein